VTSAHDTMSILAALLTGLLYVVPIVSIALAIYYFMRKRRGLAWLCTGIAAVSLAPLAVFLVVYYDAATFPGKREAALAGLPREPIAPATRPKSLMIEGDIANAGRLIATGILDEILQLPDGRAWPRKLRFTARHAESCIDDNTNGAGFGETLSAAMLARSAYMVCPASTKLVEMPQEMPPVTLQRDDYASLAIREKPGMQGYNFTYRAWELRWAPSQGGKLIAYDEILYVERPVYYLDWQMGFYHGDGRPFGERKDWSSYEFIAKAFGIDPAKDIAFSATPEELTLAASNLVARMNAGKGGRGDALRLLIGQWGDTPALRAGLNGLDPKQAGSFVVESLAILANDAFDAKRRELYPKLHEFRDALTGLCPAIPDPSLCEKTVPEIEKRALEGAYAAS
jgi:hypothetical protein